MEKIFAGFRLECSLKSNPLTIQTVEWFKQGKKKVYNSNDLKYFFGLINQFEINYLLMDCYLKF